MKTDTPFVGRRPPVSAAPAVPAAHLCLDEIVQMLRDLKGDLAEIRAALHSRRKSHYTVEEVAELTGRSEYTVRRWISEQRIKAIRIAGTGPRGRLLIPREELDTLIASGLGAAVPEAGMGEPSQSSAT